MEVIHVSDEQPFDDPGQAASGEAGSAAPRRSYKAYSVTNTFEIVAHSEEQARKRFDDLMMFLAGLSTYSEFPFPAMLYVRQTGTIDRVELAFEEVDDEGPLGASMLSNMEFMYDWWDPDSDADYNPDELARRVLDSNWNEPPE
jgi:hypothetical protein